MILGELNRWAWGEPASSWERKKKRRAWVRATPWPREQVGGGRTVEDQIANHLDAPSLFILTLVLFSFTHLAG